MKTLTTQAKIGDFLKRIKRPIDLIDDKEYKLVTIKLHHNGVTLRGTKKGSEIKSKMYEVKAGDFILSGIDARNGAFGIVPEELDGAIVTNDFWYFEIDENIINKHFFLELTATDWFDDICTKGSDGTTQRIRLQKDRFFNQSITIPSLERQKLQLEKIQKVKDLCLKFTDNIQEQEVYVNDILLVEFGKIIKDSSYKKMEEVAPIVRRKVDIDPNIEYPELGIRSFGKGTFLKPSIKGKDLGSKKLYEIHKGDLLFNNVFSWEGAFAVVGEKGHKRFGSHRFISCVCNEKTIKPRFLHYYFLSPEGIEKIRRASPGSAGRNRTLGLKKLESITVPVPPIGVQEKFIRLLLNTKKLVRQNISNTEISTQIYKVLLKETFKE